MIRRLLEWADILIENTSTGTMADMGVPYELVHEINPRLVYASSQLMGSSGPWKDWLGYGPSTRPVGGMTHLWNFADGGDPPGSGAIHPDHLVGRMLALGALAGVIGRQRGGEGFHVEVAQVETVINTLGDLFLKEALEPGSVGPQGNRNERARHGACTSASARSGGASSPSVTTTTGGPSARRSATPSGPARRARHVSTAGGPPTTSSTPASGSGRRPAPTATSWSCCRVPACRPAVMSYPTDLAEGPHSVARDYPAGRAAADRRAVAGGTGRSSPTDAGAVHRRRRRCSASTPA